MKKKSARVLSTLLMMCFVLSAFYLREQSQPKPMQIPVTQVLSYAVQTTTSPTPLESYQMQKEKERAESLAALAQLSESGDETAEKYMLLLIERGEMELAVESALAAAGFENAVCAVREGAVTVCVQERIDGEKAQWLIEICEKITGECAENVFLLDESGYSW